MSTIVKYRELVERLYKSTQNAKIRWSEDGLGNGFTAPIGLRSVIISKSTNFNGEPIIRLGIRDELDTEVESFDDEEIAGPPPSVPGFASYWYLMEDLFKTAKRQATGADMTLDRILGDLSD